MMDPQDNLVKPKNYINDFRGLEVLRFILSLSVIVWHYQHFFYPFVPFSKRALFLDKQPFFKELSFLYTEGLYAVHIFWFISGIIFLSVYEKKIAGFKTTFGSYVINRFSRLYPLHLFTLILVVILQNYYFNVNNQYFIYSENTVKTFFQNLLFVQTWGINKFSFNGPTWSVSIEILVYLVFFILAATGFLSKFRSLILMFVFFALLKKWELIFISEDIVTCFYFFFAGCLFIKGYDRIKTDLRKVLTIILILALMYIFILHLPLNLTGIYSKITGRLDVDILLFAVMVIMGFLCLFSLKIFDKIPIKYFQYLGDMTYSTYLIHFPLQLILYIILKPTNYQMFFSERFFVFYLVGVVVFGRLFFVYLELPVQRLIRNKFSAQAG